MKSLIFLLVLFIVHTASLWQPSEKLAGDHADIMAHAPLAQWYCTDILTWKLHTDRFLAPGGANIAGAYDSPFPMILTCPFLGAGPIAQYNLFAALGVLLIILSGWLVARELFVSEVWRAAYVLSAWWTGFYVSRVHQHFTLVAMIWGLQLLLWSTLTIDWKKRKNVLLRAFGLGLAFAGTAYNLAILTWPLLILLGLSLWRARKDSSKAALAKQVGFAALVVAGTFLLFFMQTVAGLGERAALDVSSAMQQYSEDLVSPFLPWHRNFLWDWLGQQAFGRPYIDYEKTTPLDWVLVVIVIASFFSREFWKSGLRRALLGMALFFQLMSFGPVFHLLGQPVAANPLFALFSRFPALSISRTPGRLAAITSLFLVFLAFDFLKFKLEDRVSPKTWKAVGLALIAWALFSGPVMNREIELPTFTYPDFLPQKGLDIIRAAPAETIVVQIPIGLSQDPAANFLQLFHGKRISSGYLSYSSYPSSILFRLANEPLVGGTFCDGDLFGDLGPRLRGGKASPPTRDFESLRPYLLAQHFTHWIVNKSMLSEPKCAALFGWMSEFVRLPWVKTEDQNDFFLVLSIQGTQG